MENRKDIVFSRVERIPITGAYRVWDTQGVPCVYPKAMLAKKIPMPFS